MFVFKAAVVGAGTMGGEIAQLIAAAGIPVVLRDVEQRLVDVGRQRAEDLTAAQLDALVWKQRLTRAQADEQLARTLALISTTTAYDGFGDVDFVIEAVPERLDLKQAVFEELDAATPGHAILASNTSALSISELASVTTRADRVLGFHFFYPASVMRLVEIVEGVETSPESMAAASRFAAAIRKTAIRCADDPGFVVNRVLMSAISELWRAQEEQGLSIAALDRAISESKAAPMGPFRLADQLGLDTVLHVAEHLQESFGERFYVHGGLRELVGKGRLGAKSGRGFYEASAAPDIGGDSVDAAELAERFTLKALVECCLVLEDGVAGAREIDLAMMAGAGLSPPPFARADAVGLGEVVGRLEQAAGRWGERFAPPTILRRLVAQGRLGAAAGQGFFPTPAPDPGQDGPIKLESRGDVAIAWIDNPPANSLSVEAIDSLARLWRGVVEDATVRVLVIASASPALFCAGADIKGMQTMQAPGQREFVDTMHSLLLEAGRSRIVTIAAINGLAYGGGCELAMGADIRIAAQSASFAQPEIKLGIIPGFGGTQRLPRLVGSGRALEMNLLGEPIDALEAWELGLVNLVVGDHELLDTALAWARRLAAAAPIAIEEIKRLSNDAGLEAGIEAEKAAFGRVFASADAREGIAAFLDKRPPEFSGS
ncbi:MAG TPA: enoyl-CoA hydratase-related protein [Solirubrobacteraceae bacterium]|nr:enoyl-CoA hydratase-related protein [Solirubrobacteraceae bacterium]